MTKENSWLDVWFPCFQALLHLLPSCTQRRRGASLHNSAPSSGAFGFLGLSQAVSQPVTVIPETSSPNSIIWGHKPVLYFIYSQTSFHIKAAGVAAHSESTLVRMFLCINIFFTPIAFWTGITVQKKPLFLVLCFKHLWIPLLEHITTFPTCIWWTHYLIISASCTTATSNKYFTPLFQRPQKVHTEISDFFPVFGAACFQLGLRLLSQLCPDNTLVLWHLVDWALVAHSFIHKQNSLNKTNNCFSFSCRQHVSALCDPQSRSLPHREAWTLIASVTATILAAIGLLEN